MQRLVTALALVGTLFPLTLQAQAPPTPGAEHKKLAIWVGDWTYETDVKATPLGPAAKFSGKLTVRPILGGFFVEFEGKTPDGTVVYREVDGYDPVAKKYVWLGFGADGTIDTVTYTIDGTTVTYSGTVVSGGKQYYMRGTVVFASDFMSDVEKREVSLDGQTWMPHSEAKFTKTKSSGQ
jgi:hypothetical protein